MKSILVELHSRFRAAIVKAFGGAFADADPVLRPSADAKFGNYQSNAAMGLAKKLSEKPRTVAEKIVGHLDYADLAQTPEIAGPGFINLRLKPEWLGERLGQVFADERLGIDRSEGTERVVVDYSGPNIAKEMHVGHLRSTIIGDAIARIFEFLGHEVIRQNHIGDWGLQMGMVTYAVEQTTEPLTDLGQLERMYRTVNKASEDPAVRAAMVQKTKDLQQTPKDELRAWQMVRAMTLSAAQGLYERLDVNLKPEDVRGESFYSDEYGPMIEELRRQGVAVETEGAIGIFPPGFTNKEGQPRPFIIQSRDGTFQYPTFDLAALRFRVRELKVRRVVYTHDSRQAEHFAMLFAVAKLLGLDRTNDHELRFDYATFGTVLGEDGKPLKTRSGENVKLAELIDEAERRAFNLVTQKNPELAEAERRTIGHAVGVGALKYADLAQNRTNDYMFSFDKMLAMDGNTAPYLMYAYARIKSIERKGGIEAGAVPAGARIVPEHPAELDLGRKLAQFPDAILDVSQHLRPNIITAYLYDLSQAFSVFYENCPVLKAESEEKRMSRLMLCDLTARTLKLGLDLLGIRTLEQM